MPIIYAIAATIVMTMFIEAPQACIWSVITDYPNIDKLDKDVKECKVVMAVGDSKRLDFLVDKRIMKLKYRVNVQEYPKNRLEWKLQSGDMKVNQGFIKLIPSTGGTQVLYHREISGVNYVPDPVLKQVASQSMRRVLRNLKEKAERESRRASKSK